jgi:DNA polymerase
MIDLIKLTPKNCTLCSLASSRTQVVYPDVITNSQDKITTIVIGEAPGANEDKEGKPFVGASGKILRKELATLPGKVIITNTVKCRPPKNRNPSKEEKNACRPFLNKEIELFSPDFIILVGRISSSLFFDNKTLKNFTELSGSLIKNNLIPVLHPASTMYNAPKNKPIWIDSWDKIRSYIKERYPNTSFSMIKDKEKVIKHKSLSDWI